MKIKSLAQIALSTSMLVAFGAAASSASAATAMTAADCHAEFQNGHYKMSFAEFRAAKCAGVHARTTRADVEKTNSMAEEKATSARRSVSERVDRTESSVRTRGERAKSSARGRVSDAKSAAAGEASSVEDKANSKASGVRGFFHRHADAAKNTADQDVSSARDTAKSSKRSIFSRRSAGGVVFPDRVSSQYSSMPEGIAREKTCADQYQANKQNGGNGNLVWTQQGGGYYSECNAHLKGE